MKSAGRTNYLMKLQVPQLIHDPKEFNRLAVVTHVHRLQVETPWLESTLAISELSLWCCNWFHHNHIYFLSPPSSAFPFFSTFFPSFLPYRKNVLIKCYAPGIVLSSRNTAVNHRLS